LTRIDTDLPAFDKSTAGRHCLFEKKLELAFEGIVEGFLLTQGGGWGIVWSYENAD
jgi:hypothetical protein